MKRRYAHPLINRIPAVGLWAVLLSLFPVSAQEKTPLLSDGLVLAGLDGALARDVNDGTWHFTLHADRLIGKTAIPKGASYELLPGYALAALAADAAQRSSSTYRLWARVTYYRGRNYLYLTPSYFIPLIDKHETPVPAPAGSARDPNQGQAIGIPAEILTLMEEQQTLATEPDVSRIVIPEDGLLLGRRAYLQREGDRSLLVLDGLGRNVSQERFVLLPSAVRERVEDRQAHHADRLYFRVGGVWNRYRGQDYLLLHQAVRLYGYGNLD
jgi:hypothetical protein